MSTLQIRNVPEELYQMLKEKSREEHRSITQQALVELKNSLEKAKRDKSREYLEELRTAQVPTLPDEIDFELMIRQLRDSH
ncbi:MAG: hypothetical protein J7L76_08245 [Spirochaetaceae bacterium]|nr:hypothetical protein [Spirochaetaceae bacterium]RKX70618.1 MAG: hypothetical protein DRP60_15585 [Spirochaetota bacterium]